MRLHAVSLPHTQTTRAFSWCAYTTKVRNLGALLHAHGHELVLYAGTENEAECDEHVTIVEPSDLNRWFDGPWDTSRVFDQWNPQAPCWTEMAAHAVNAIRARIAPGNAVGVIAGRCQQPIADAFPDHPTLEWGIGYVGVLANSFRCFESRAHQNYVAGYHHDDNGHFFDTVIPNSFDPADFTYSTAKDDYLLFLGRMTERKGLAIVEELAKDHRVITAGQGDLRVPGAEHRGLVRGAERAELLARARGLLCPTTYLEPFGGVAVEAMLSGTPVISTDFGAFPETIREGVTGFRCTMLRDFQDAAKRVADLDPADCRAHAMNNYSLDSVAPMYDRWLQQIATLQRDGWYQS